MQNSNLSFYEIYPTAFYDSNDDGIGDIKGIIKKLDYVKKLGFKGIWFNPFFKSPFRDGGYDISNYFEIDEKFGTNKDAIKLIKECHKRNLLVFFDLVAGHMSLDSKEFIESSKANPNPKYKDMFIWTNSAWTWDGRYSLIKGLYPRNGTYMVNFFVHQPALNYGFGNVDASWKYSYDSQNVKITMDYIIKVMKFWCEKGVDGYRCDMADSLVKDDTSDKKHTQECWNYMFGEVRKTYPNMISVSEWCSPTQSLNCAFDMDFILDHSDNFSYYFFRAGTEDWEKLTSSPMKDKVPLLRKYDDELYSKAIENLKFWISTQEKYKNKYIAPISGNHDTFRIANSLSNNQLKDAYIMLFTLPGIPFVYAGDELKQKTKKGYPSKDGGYQRTGTRFGMNWDKSKKNHGFSNANEIDLYLPVDKSGDDSISAIKDKTSLLNLIVALNKLRDENPDLTSHDGFELLSQPLSYKRGKILVAINLEEEPMVLKLNKGKSLLTVGKIKCNSTSVELQHNAAIIYKED